MAKKLLTSGIVAIIFIFCTSFCFATDGGNNSSDSQKSDLGSELTDSMNKIEKSADDLTDKMRNDDRDKNAVDGAITDNKLTSDYNATRTSLETDVTNATGMSGTTWIWIILAVVGVIILATVWFYAMQNNGND